MDGVFYSRVVADLLEEQGDRLKLLALLTLHLKGPLQRIFHVLHLRLLDPDLLLHDAAISLQLIVWGLAKK